MPETTATSSTDDGLLQSPKQRHRRARTGCERCRAQRRKCDEAKPQCRRCNDARATCKYVAPISFLDKNSRTLPNDLASRLSSASAAPGYSVLEFVANNDSSTQRTASGSPSTSTIADHTVKSQGQQSNLESVQKSRPVFQMDNSQHQPEDMSHPFQQKDVQSLKMAELGNTEDPNYRSLSFDSTQSLASGDIDNSWPLAGRSSLSDDELGLLKYYNCHVAPWLDVYDQSQTFHHLLTRLALTSPCVLEAILHLAAVFSGRSKRVVQHRGVGALHLRAMSFPPSVRSPFSNLRLMASFVLVRTLLFVEAVPDTWEHTFHRGSSSVGFNEVNLVDAVQQRVWVSCLALIARLEIAYSLMNESAPVMISELWQQILSPSKTYEMSVDQSRRILYASLGCLGLLADVMNLCLPAPVSEDNASSSRAGDSTLVGISRVVRWKKLLDELWAWHKDRPPELQQLMEVEGHEATFPTVIFVSGAGISSNILYHTAMLLLLSNKPQSISLAEWDGDPELEAAQRSPLWHARRVCGIALNSDPEHTHCWEPCMIAAFSLAARKMAHRSQQNDILECLRRVKIAGWHIDGLVQKLRDEWGPVG